MCTCVGHFYKVFASNLLVVDLAQFEVKMIQIRFMCPGMMEAVS